MCSSMYVTCMHVCSMYVACMQHLSNKYTAKWSEYNVHISFVKTLVPFCWDQNNGWYMSILPNGGCLKCCYPQWWSILIGFSFPWNQPCSSWNIPIYEAPNIHRCSSPCRQVPGKAPLLQPLLRWPSAPARGAAWPLIAHPRLFGWDQHLVFPGFWSWLVHPKKPGKTTVTSCFLTMI